MNIEFLNMAYSRGMNPKSRNGFQKGEKNFRWKGGDVGYRALHNWIENNLGKASKCVNDITHKSKRYQWGNKSGEYKRDIEDWHELCASCNRKDGIKKAKRFLSI